MPDLPVISAHHLAHLVGGLPGEQAAYKELADAIRLLIVDGRVALGTRLPSERSLTDALELSRTTVAAAYALLRERGYLASRRGSGSVARLPEGRIRRSTSAALVPPNGVEAGLIDLTCAAGRAVCGVAEAYEAALADLPMHLTGAGYLSQGVPELREAIAERFTARGLPTSADQILVTTGALAAVGVALRALTRAGETVVVESPTYPNVVDALRRSSLRLRPAPVEPTGWDGAQLASTITATRPRAAYLIPDFHNPTGSLMPDDQREQLASALASAGTTALVDETIVEVDLRSPRAPMPAPFATFAPDAVTVGSASKSHWGGLRVGWLRAPGDTIDRFIDARATCDLGAAALEQLVLLQLLRQESALAADRRADLIAARDALAGALAERLPQLRFVLPPGGLSLWVELPTATATALALAAEDEGLLIAAGPRFAVEGGLDRWVRLPYVLNPADLVEAVARLASAYERVADSLAGRGRSGAARPLIA